MSVSVFGVCMGECVCVCVCMCSVCVCLHVQCVYHVDGGGGAYTDVHVQLIKDHSPKHQQKSLQQQQMVINKEGLPLTRTVLHGFITTSTTLPWAASPATTPTRHTHTAWSAPAEMC